MKLLYLVSYYQNPTGLTTSYEKKSAALKLLRQYERAAGHPIYLLEDAAYRELRFKGDDVKSALAASGSSDRVIYAGTYSKPFATGTRVGFGLLPEEVFTTVLRIKGNHDFGSSNLLQHLLARALASGLYEQHLRRCASVIGAKPALMRAAYASIFPPRWSGTIRQADFISGLACRAASSRAWLQRCFKRRWRRTCSTCRANSATPTIRPAANRITKCASVSAARRKTTCAGITRLGAVLRKIIG